MLSSVPGIENLPPAIKYLIAFAIIFALLALFALVLRRLTGGRLTLANSGGRARQPRLGIVDVYDLDRQRQLILLRRDNVEHLLLVGGPNDVVVETNIVRGPGGRALQPPAEAIEGAPDRPAELAAPSRPVIEAPQSRSPVRQIEPAGLNAAIRSDAPSSAAASARAPAPDRPAPEPATKAPSGPVPSRPADRPARTAPPTSAAPPAPSPARPSPARTMARTGPNGAPPREGEGGGRSGLSDMARQLEDALRRPSEPQAPAPRAVPTGRPAPPRPQRSEPIPTPAPVAAVPVITPEPERAETPRPQPAPTRPETPRPPQPPPRPERNSAPAPVRPTTPAPSPQPAPPAEIVVEPTEPPAPTPASSVPQPAPPGPRQPPRVQAAEAAPVPVPEPAPPPPPVVDEPTPEPEPLPAPSTPSRPDPFSIEDIEAEFARLLGRPLDRKDGNKS